MKLIIFLGIFLSLPNTGWGLIFRIPDDQPTIQAGIDRSFNGDTILVAPGIYHENLDFHSKAITLMSLDGYESTTLESVGDNIPLMNIYNVINGQLIIDGFYIEPTNNNKILITEGSECLIKNCYFNQGTSEGIHIQNNAHATITHNIITNNYKWAIHVNKASCDITYNLFKDNIATSIFIEYGLRSKVLNNTFDQFGCGVYALGSVFSNDKYVIINYNIFTNGEFTYRGNISEFDYNLTYNNDFSLFDHSVEGEHNYHHPAFYCDPANNDYHLVTTHSFGLPENNPYNINIGAFGGGCDCCRGMRGDFWYKEGYNENFYLDEYSLDWFDVAYFSYYQFHILYDPPEPYCFEESDLNADGIIDIEDMIYLIDYLYRDGPPPLPCP